MGTEADFTYFCTENMCAITKNRCNMVTERNKYLAMLVAGQGNGLVKIVTGGRRCGKTFLLFRIFHDYLLGHGVDSGHLILTMSESKDYPFALLVLGVAQAAVCQIITLI